MPKKTIYVRDEDMPLFEKAMKKLGGEESMGSVIVDALRKSLKDYEKEEEEAFRLAVVMNCPLPSVLAECVEYRLQAIPADIIANARFAADAAYAEDPDHFGYVDFTNIDSNEWWEKTKKKASRGKQKRYERFKAAWQLAANRFREQGLEPPAMGWPIPEKEAEHFVRLLISEVQTLEKQGEEEEGK